MKNKILGRALRVMGVCAGLATVLSVIGAYNTEQFGWPGVWLYWFILLVIGAGIGTMVFDKVAHEWLADQHWIVRWLAGSTALTVPMVGVVSIAQTVIGYPIPARALLQFGLQVGLITFTVGAVQMALDTYGQASAARTATPAPTPEAPMSAAPAPVALAPQTAPAPASGGLPSFARRLPPKLMGAEIWALSAEDHYVRVHSSKGADLVLIRLADAIAEMDGMEGVQTHRSWWVAKAGVQAARKRTEGGVITLRSGVEAPISRGFMAGVIAKGWV